MNGVALNSMHAISSISCLQRMLTLMFAAYTQFKLDQEQQWRTDADNWLQQQINNEQTARINAISKSRHGVKMPMLI